MAALVVIALPAMRDPGCEPDRRKYGRVERNRFAGRNMDHRPAEEAIHRVPRLGLCGRLVGGARMLHGVKDSDLGQRQGKWWQDSREVEEVHADRDHRRATQQLPACRSEAFASEGHEQPQKEEEGEDGNGTTREKGQLSDVVRHHGNREHGVRVGREKEQQRRKDQTRVVLSEDLVADEKRYQCPDEKPRGRERGAARVEDEESAPQSAERELGCCGQVFSPAFVRCCGRRCTACLGRFFIVHVHCACCSSSLVRASLQCMCGGNSDRSECQIRAEDEMRAGPVDATEGDAVDAEACNHRQRGEVALVTQDRRYPACDRVFRESD